MPNAKYWLSVFDKKYERLGEFNEAELNEKLREYGLTDEQQIAELKKKGELYPGDLGFYVDGPFYGPKPQGDDAGTETHRMIKLLKNAGHEATFSHFGADVTANIYKTYKDDSYRVEVRVEGELDDLNVTELHGLWNSMRTGKKPVKWDEQLIIKDANHDTNVLAAVTKMFQVAGT